MPVFIINAFCCEIFSEEGILWDPLNTAMDLYRELHELARCEREVEKAFIELANKCETFALKLQKVGTA